MNPTPDLDRQASGDSAKIFAARNPAPAKPPVAVTQAPDMNTPSRPSPSEQLKRITDGFLDMARHCEQADPERAKQIREHVAQARLHYAQMDALLIQFFGRSLEDRDVCATT